MLNQCEKLLDEPPEDFLADVAGASRELLVAEESGKLSISVLCPAIGDHQPSDASVSIVVLSSQVKGEL